MYLPLPRNVYSVLLYLLLPVAVIRVLWKGIALPGYWRRLPERLGFGDRSGENASPLWIHAVSVGEVQAAALLIRAFLKRHPGTTVLVTTTTPTGYCRLLELFGGEVRHRYLPVDTPDAVARFLDRVKPSAAVIMETEIWPNLFRACHRRGVPLVMANSRLSARSAARYRWAAGLVRQTLEWVSVIAAQGAADAERFIGLGAPRERVKTTGNIKFDLPLPASLREQAAVMRRSWGTARSIWVAASTHEGEEEQVIEAHRQLLRCHPESLLVLVPRHPERFSRVASLCARSGLAYVTRSSGGACSADIAIFLGDSMGELLLFLAAADVAFVGGSLVPHGGHNVLEPAGLGLPVVFGPYVHNFEDVSARLVQRGAARQITGAGGLSDAVSGWFDDASERSRVGERGRLFVEANRGALGRLLALVESQMARARSARDAEASP